MEFCDWRMVFGIGLLPSMPPAALFLGAIQERGERRSLAQRREGLPSGLVEGRFLGRFSTPGAYTWAVGALSDRCGGFRFGGAVGCLGLKKGSGFEVVTIKARRAFVPRAYLC